ncbi:unnamed protein product [Bursaphelenchus xylophilus]|uniref:(pine wood nematode) hypothetical protein n=1 Tax=Bursaphelenchus xylophilus TaxID=6326 RepID=A0A1I7SR58_BURXY|nr:unnamed protein product [Bursaphelenchus xylophilus]CAG9110867.1 unnamed protein product [Bursaphelenchus xylophilus]
MTFRDAGIILILVVEQFLLSSLPLDQFLYITVKSTESNHNTRLKDLQNTWFKDLKQAEINIVSDSENGLDGWLKEKVVATNCGKSHARRDLVCKLQKELQLFKHANAKWSCHFDDDSYVNVKNLKQFLSNYDENDVYYIGKAMTGPIKVNQDYKFMFATGGAGFCISRGVLNLLQDEAIAQFSHLSEELGMPDDMTLAVFLDKKAGVRLTYRSEFHSHLESHLIHLQDLQYQVSLARTVIPGTFAMDKVRWMEKIDCFLNLTRCKYQEYTA